MKEWKPEYLEKTPDDGLQKIKNLTSLDLSLQFFCVQCKGFAVIHGNIMPLDKELVSNWFYVLLTTKGFTMWLAPEVRRVCRDYSKHPWFVSSSVTYIIEY